MPTTTADAHDDLKAEHAGLATEHAGLVTDHDGLGLASEHTGLAINHGGLIADHDGLATDHDGLGLATEHTSLDQKLDQILTATAATVPGYVGITEATALGDQGVFTFSRMCHSEFPGSRFCTTEEAFRTVNPVNIAGDPAWIHPIFIVPDAATTLRGAVLFYGFVVQAASRTCGGWSGVGTSGMTLNPQSGAVGTASCSLPLPVACCIP